MRKLWRTGFPWLPKMMRARGSLNLPAGSIFSWGEMRERFVANFQGTRDRPPVAGDLWRIKQ